MRMASVEGSPDAVAGLLGELRLPASAEVLGPVPVGATSAAGADESQRERALVRVPRGDGRLLAAALAAAQAVRTARKEPDPVRIRVDPLEIL
jgi:primosomal protein N' (replication factor Y)